MSAKLLTVLNGLSYNAKGALALQSTGSALLDFFSKSGALREASSDQIVKLFEPAFEEDPALAFKALFYARDVRGGQGERRVFRTIVSYLANKETDALRFLLPFFAEYGRWDDLLELALTPLEKDAFDILGAQFNKDLTPASPKDNPSLLSKWLPSENASSSKTKMLARRFAKHCGFSMSNYRKNLSGLRAKINVLERQLCAEEWDKVNYEHVPSRAGLIYRKAFQKHDSERYTSFKEKVKKGEAKVNTKVLFPYELIRPFFTSGMDKIGDSYYATAKQLSPAEEDSLDLLWNQLPNYLGEEPEDGLVVADTSGSMKGLPIQVAASLALYYAERNKGSFGGYFITFSNNPTLQSVKGKTIGDRVRNLVTTEWNKNTNLQAVFDLVLDRAVKHNLKQEDLPARIFIVSDMQFDIAVPRNTFTNLETIQDKYKAAGYKAPELVFWNVNAGSTAVAKKDEKGIKLVSGCSGAIFKQLLSSHTEDPYGHMMETLLSDRYEPITYYGTQKAQQ